MSSIKQEYPRLEDELIEYLPLLGTGLHLLSSTWIFPPEPDSFRKLKKVRVRVDENQSKLIGEIAAHGKTSRELVIIAALRHAQSSARRPSGAAGSKEPAAPKTRAR